MRRRHRPLVLAPGDPPVFPDPRGADAEGLVAIGGDLAVSRLLAAYDRGIFPWYDRGLPPLWWSPDPRTVIDLEHLHVSRSMRRAMRQAGFTVTANQRFENVMLACAQDRDGGTWILPEMVRAYQQLHELGHAHSIEVFLQDQLVGGLYGVQRGAFFAAESMFHRCTNASKVALIASVQLLFAAGIQLFDVQFLTPHLESMGAREIPRDTYLDRLAQAIQKPVSLTGAPPEATA